MFYSVANNFIGVDSVSMTTYQKQDRGAKWFRSVDGIWTTEKQFEGIDIDTQDWTDFLGGETIATAAFTADGVTLNSSSNTSTTTTANVTGAGSLHIDITTSTGRMFREYFRWRRLHRAVAEGIGDGGSLPGDYHV